MTIGRVSPRPHREHTSLALSYSGPKIAAILTTASPTKGEVLPGIPFAFLVTRVVVHQRKALFPYSSLGFSLPPCLRIESKQVLYLHMARPVPSLHRVP